MINLTIIGFIFWIFRGPFNKISEDYQHKPVQELNIIIWDFFFYLLLGIVITLSVQIAGVVLVFAYLIIPATISATFSARPGIQIGIVWSTPIAASLGALLFAYYLDFSIGPAIALFLGCELVIASVIAKF